MLNMLMLTLMENLDLLQKRLVKLPLQKKKADELGTVISRIRIEG